MDAPDNSASITDSPWFWAYLFGVGGLIALLLMGPRFTARQSQIERKTEGRLRAAENVRDPGPGSDPTGELTASPTTAGEEEPTTAIRLQPLIALLAGVVLLSGGVLVWKWKLRQQQGLPS